MRSNQSVARKRSPPIALAACDKYDLAPFVGEPIERLLDCEIGAPFALPSARVRKHVGPPVFARRLLRMRPRATFDGIARSQHGGYQTPDFRQATIE